MIWALFIIGNVNISEQNLSRTLNFAEKLKQEGDYFRAITEFKRYWFYSKDKPDSILYKIANIYLGENLPDNAVDILKYIKHKDSTYFKILATAYFKVGNYTKARELWKNDKFLGLTYLYQRRFKEAEKYLGNIGRPNKKSPLLGVVFSLFPGGGKFYAGRNFDGIMSLIGILSTGLPAAYYIYKGKDNVQTYIYGGISMFFYLGSIYGGWIAVKVYNDKSEENFIHSIEMSINWN